MKKLVYPLLILAYAAVLVASLLVAVKPGAAIFHWKTTLEPQLFRNDEGFSYRYWINLPPALFPPDKVLLFEDGKQLPRAIGKNLIDIGNGVYDTERSLEGGFYVYISPTGNGDPASNGKAYRLYIASNLLSHTMGIFYFSTLLFGAYIFIRFAFSTQGRPRLPGLAGLAQLVEGYRAHLQAAAAHLHAHTRAPWRSRLAEGGRLLVLTVLTAYGLVLMEWIFHVTKISFMDDMSLGTKVGIFLISSLAVAAAGIAINIALLVAELFLRPLRLAWLPACLSLVVPAALLTSLAVLWLDSFTYTLFHFGILSSTGLVRLVYGILISLLFWGFYRWLLGWWGFVVPARLKPATFRWLSRTALGLLAISAVVAAVQFAANAEEITHRMGLTASAKNLPNIILIGSDGLSAKNMSVYGYPRETTPNIAALAEVSLVAENAYTNSASTYGSLIALFTSKMPTRTGVYYPPDILTGVNSYQHLPGELKNLGYTNIQIGMTYFVDATNWNIQNAFDIVNRRTAQKDVIVKTLNQLGYDLPALFIVAVEERLVDRVYQALHIDTIPNPFTVVTEAPSWRDDRRRIDDLLYFLANTPEPLFFHVHLMGTHGSHFLPAERTFSVNQVQDEKWIIDFYDDAILTYDAYIGELVDALKASGEFDQTILILYADHAMKFQSQERIPLIFHFPGDQYQGRVQTNAQNLDIAPTLLDYLEVPVPEWMEGESILSFSTQVREPIFSVYRNAAYQVFYCQRMYALDMRTHVWSTLDVDGYTAPCDESQLPGIPQISRDLAAFLESQGQDPSVVP